MASMFSQGGFSSLPPALSGDTLIDCSRNHLRYPNGVPIRELVCEDIPFMFVVPTVNAMTGEVVYVRATAMHVGHAPCISLTVCRPSANAPEEAEGVEYRTITCTEEQCFLTATSHQYRSAGSLRYGDRLQVARAVSYIFRPDGKYRTRQRTECRVSIVQGWAGKSTIKYEHRLIAEAIYGRIPEGFHVHHLDEERLNNEPANLRIVSPAEHRAEHADEDKRPTFYTGKATTDEDAKWRDREWLMKQLSKKTVIDIAAECNVSFETIERWCNKFDLSPSSIFERAKPKRKRKSSMAEATIGRPKGGAWTVLGSEPYQDGEPIDVYGISIKTSDFLYHNLQVEGIVVQSHEPLTILPTPAK